MTALNGDTSVTLSDGLGTSRVERTTGDATSSSYSPSDEDDAGRRACEQVSARRKRDARVAVETKK